MRKCPLPLALLLFACVLHAAENDAVQKTPVRTPDFKSDYVCFKAPDARSYVEIYNQIAFSQLCFQRSSRGEFVAAVTLDISLTKQNKALLRNSRTDTLHVDTFEKTLTSREVLSCLQSYFVDAGVYGCRVAITDQLTGKRAVKAFEVHVPEFTSPDLRLSEIQFASRISESENDGPFVKSGLYVVPNPHAAYGYFAASIPVYYEIYNIPVSSEKTSKYLDVDFKILSASNRDVVKKINRGSYFSARECIQSALLPVQELAPGDYNLQIIVTDPANGTQATAGGKFTVGKEVVSSSGLSVDDLINQLKFVAKKSEILQLRFLNPEKKRRAMLGFWAAKDPTPKSPENEKMQEFYRRIDFVNQLFSTADQQGWETEAGRIYMQLGPPDRISQGCYLNRRESCEVWTYKHLKRRYFLFSGNDVVKLRL